MEERITSSITQREKRVCDMVNGCDLSTAVSVTTTALHEVPALSLSRQDWVQDMWGPFTELLHLGAAVLWPIKENWG